MIGRQSSALQFNSLHSELWKIARKKWKKSAKRDLSVYLKKNVITSSKNDKMSGISSNFNISCKNKESSIYEKSIPTDFINLSGEAEKFIGHSETFENPNQTFKSLSNKTDVQEPSFKNDKNDRMELYRQWTSPKINKIIAKRKPGFLMGVVDGLLNFASQIFT